ncbi:MAG: TonB-dependent receptor [Acidobacteriota bacterium]|nr:TonB-dependent receptor [Acidobacteriota bacterium]
MTRVSIRRASLCALLCFLLAGPVPPLLAQGLGGTGTVQGTVTDPSGAVIPGATVVLSNALAQFERQAVTDGQGAFAFTNVPQDTYALIVTLEGFQTVRRTVRVRSAVPIALDVELSLAATSTTVVVHGSEQSLVANVPTARTNLDAATIKALPIQGSNPSGLSELLALAAPGVVADSNGFFHPLGDHAQTEFSIDNQPVPDQQSRVYSNQLPLDAVQSTEVVAGMPPAQYGDKTGLIVNIITKSGLGHQQPQGSVSAQYGSFGTGTGDVTLGFGRDGWGNFGLVNGYRSNRYLDGPEFKALHDTGDSISAFDRVDVRPTPEGGTLHLNLLYGRSAFQIPNTYDEQVAGQQQQQRITTINVAPGWSQTLTSNLLITANAYARHDAVTYQPSPDPFSDTPATIAQHRTLLNSGGTFEVSYFKGVHNIRAGANVAFWQLHEDFSLGLTDPGFNAPCLAASGSPDAGPLPAGGCGAAGLTANDAYLPALAAYDLTRGGSLFHFNDSGLIKEQSAYAQDSISLKQLTLDLGARFDRYDGLSRATAFEPRLGVSYQLPTGGVLRAAWGKTLETPYNENLLLSSATGAGGLANTVFGAVGGTALVPARRRIWTVGASQPIGSWVVVEVNYLSKYTTNAFDFDTLFNTPIAFPIEWAKSEETGIDGKVTLLPHHGFSAYTVFGHAHALFFNPETGGIVFNSPLATRAFLIDHDQKFEQTTSVQYSFPGRLGAWATLTWNYESGLVNGSVPDYATALMLTADQQAAIGLYCGSTFATPTMGITACNSPTFGATRVVIPAAGTENDATNPGRIAPRNLFDLGVGVDNLLLSADERRRVSVRLTIINLMNKEALYNFLSTFSGTHFVAPRSVAVQVAYHF